MRLSGFTAFPLHGWPMLGLAKLLLSAAALALAPAWTGKRTAGRTVPQAADSATTSRALCAVDGVPPPPRLFRPATPAFPG